jgi:hypothetical protein
MACVLTATLLGPNATLAEAGAKMVFSRSKPHVNVSVPASQRPSTFAVDMEVSEGLLRGAIVPLAPDTRVQGKHSATQLTADGLLTMTFGTRWQQHAADGVLELGTLTVQAQSARPAGGGGGGNIIVFDIVDSVADSAAALPEQETLTGQAQSAGPAGGGGGGDIIVFDIVDSVADSDAAVLELRFEARPGEQLVGRPAALFNTPGPGEPLVARLPTPAPGETLDLVLEVHTSEAGTLIPVKIKHNL